ncbi:DUF370 domain-containing protein [Ruminococcaceae bacterium OttesenSCG-928-I18]|nr:DUF370 domain-containing protein [Ruminococcaceae bacterium OttesenSCG-928-I18]
MYLHLGQETTVLTKDMLGIFDLDTSTISKHSREYLARAEREGRVVNTSSELPKSFVVSVGRKGRVYICQNSTATIKKRLDLLEKNAKKIHNLML